MAAQLLRHVIVFMVLVSWWSAHGASTGTMTDAQVMNYLSRFGYLDNEVHSMSDVSTKEGIRSFQKFFGMKSATGEMDDSTRAMMMMPRCGITDNTGAAKKWPKKEVKYRITSYSRQNLDHRAVDRVIAEAFQLWSDVTDLTFSPQTSRAAADIDIDFATDNHDDGNEFDGQGGTYAHAFSPNRGDAHFDDAEIWAISGGDEGTINLMQVATHEFGHSLGLGHSDVPGAVMAPIYAYKPDFALHSDDVAGVQYLYGMKTEQTKPTSPPSAVNELCADPTIDAAFSSPDRKTYFFKGMNYWEVTDKGMSGGYPKMINTRWPELPRSLDAAFTQSRTNKTLFFKGMQVWKYSGFSLDSGYPKRISEEFPGLNVNDLDTAFEWSQDGKMYFFRAGKYWSYSNGRVGDGYPKPVADWGLPAKVDAAVRYFYHGYRMYFFVGRQFYRFQDNTFSITRESPLRTALNWLKCPHSYP